MPERSIVFISCGQVAEEEKQLGKDICRLVREATPFEPYFAENQSGLEAVTRNILGNLDKSVGLVAVMHPRGRVTSHTGNQHVRASVWVEQEIAIAAYMTQILGRRLNVAAYEHATIRREGIREQLILNPKSFQSSTEVLADLANLLPKWSETMPSQGVEIRIDFKPHRITQKLHEYQLYVNLLNQGSNVVENYHLDLSFPAKFLDTGMSFANEVAGRRTQTERVFRATSQNLGSLFPGDPIRVLTLDYFVDDRLFWQANGDFREKVKATLYIPGEQTREVAIGIQKLQKF
jgi:hypothetical protein